MLFFFSAGCFPCKNIWSLLDQKSRSSVASIILEHSSPGSRITACQLRVKYFSTSTPLFFTSGSTDVSLVPWPFYLPCLLSEKKGGGHIKKGYSARREEEEMFLCIILLMWSSRRSVSMNSLSAPKGKYFSVGIWGMKPEVLCFDPCALPPPPLPSPSPPPTRFQGLGQRLVVLSPSAAETWYQESQLSSSFIVPSQVRLFTSFLYCSPASPSLPPETTNIEKSNLLRP